MAGKSKYDRTWLERELKANPHIQRSPALYKHNPSAYQALKGQEWFAEVLKAAGVEVVPSRRGAWTEEAIKAAVALHGWTSTGQMRKSDIGKSIVSTCTNRGLLHLLPPSVPRYQNYEPPSRPPKAPPPVPINCWPFEGPATKADSAVESGAS